MFSLFAFSGICNRRAGIGKLLPGAIAAFAGCVTLAWSALASAAASDGVRCPNGYDTTTTQRARPCVASAAPCLSPTVATRRHPSMSSIAPTKGRDFAFADRWRRCQACSPTTMRGGARRSASATTAKDSSGNSTLTPAPMSAIAAGQPASTGFIRASNSAGTTGPRGHHADSSSPQTAAPYSAGNRTVQSAAGAPAAAQERRRTDRDRKADVRGANHQGW